MKEKPGSADQASKQLKQFPIAKFWRSSPRQPPGPPQETASDVAADTATDWQEIVPPKKRGPGRPRKVPPTSQPKGDATGPTGDAGSSLGGTAATSSLGDTVADMSPLAQAGEADEDAMLDADVMLR